MPLPRSVARFNKRYTNRLVEPLVARTATFAIIEHTGRRSGRTFRTPINLFPCGERFVAALTYGPTADWVQNVSAGPAIAELSGVRRQIQRTDLADRAEIWQCLPRVARPVLRLLRIDHFLLVSLSGGKTSL